MGVIDYGLSLNGGTATASSNAANHGPELANDADTGTYYQPAASGVGHWLKIDLGASKRVLAVALAQGVIAHSAWTLESSDDDSSYTSRGTFADASTTIPVFFPNAVFDRYWRITSTTANRQPTVYVFNVLGDLIEQDYLNTFASPTLGYPGAELVTWGDQLTMDQPEIFTVDCHGIALTLTSAPARIARHEVVTDLWTYWGAGYIAFGDVDFWEAPQHISFDKRIYTPRSITRPNRVLVNPVPGLEGTIVPYLVSGVQ